MTGQPNKFGVTGSGNRAVPGGGGSRAQVRPNKLGGTRTGADVPPAGGRQGENGRPNKFGVTSRDTATSNSFSRRGNQATIAVHFIFPTHNRRPVFEVEEFRSLIEKLLLQIATEKGLESIALNVLADHVHILLRKETRRSDAEVMKLLKGASARYFFLQYPEVKEGLRSQSLWAHGYYSRFIPRSDIPRVVQYIREQKDGEGTDKRYLDGLHIRDCISLTGDE